MVHLPLNPTDYEALYLQISGTAKHLGESTESDAIPVPMAHLSAKADVNQSAPVTESGRIEGVDTDEGEEAISTDKMQWPVRGRIISSFGNVDGRYNGGIDIAVPEGTPVQAAESGVVIFAGDGLKDFGRTVLVRHGNGLVTVYGHASELKVARGDNVKRGEIIATSGMSGKTDTPKLHFEVRRNSAPADPAEFLGGLVGPPSAHEEIATAPLGGRKNCAALVLIKAGLKAFGNSHLDVDCNLSSETTKALAEFIQLFQLGESADYDAVLVKMKEIGLTP